MLAKIVGSWSAREEIVGGQKKDVLKPGHKIVGLVVVVRIHRHSGLRIDDYLNVRIFCLYFK